LINYHNLNNAELANLLLADVGINREMLVEVAKRLGTAGTRQHNKWEYLEVDTRCEQSNNKEYRDMLNQYGRKGWELVSEVVTETLQDGSWETRVTFKREMMLNYLGNAGWEFGEDCEEFELYTFKRIKT